MKYASYSIGLMLVSWGGGWPNHQHPIAVILRIVGYIVLYYSGKQWFAHIYPDAGIVLLPNIFLTFEITMYMVSILIIKYSNLLLYKLIEILLALILFFLTLYYILFFKELEGLSEVKINLKKFYIGVGILAIVKVIEIFSYVISPYAYITISWGYFFGFAFFSVIILRSFEQRIKRQCIERNT